MMAARPRCGEAKKVAKGTGIMALTANARLPRNKKSGLQFLIAAKDRGFPQEGGVSGHLRPRIGLTGSSRNDEFGSICWADKTHPLSSCLPEARSAWTYSAVGLMPPDFRYRFGIRPGHHE